MRTALILTGGESAPGAPLPHPDVVIAADSGLALARQLGLTVDTVIGDMDSVDPSTLAAAEASGVEVVRYPEDKDATDLELAMELAMTHHPDKIVVVGGIGGRLDHLLANASLLASDRYESVAVEWRAGRDAFAVVRDQLIVNGRPGDTVTLLAAGTEVTVTTDGLRWALDHDTLPLGTTRGVSNELAGDEAAITVHEGVALVITRRDP